MKFACNIKSKNLDHNFTFDKWPYCGQVLLKSNNSKDASYRCRDGFFLFSTWKSFSCQEIFCTKPRDEKVWKTQFFFTPLQYTVPSGVKLWAISLNQIYEDFLGLHFSCVLSFPIILPSITFPKNVWEPSGGCAVISFRVGKKGRRKWVILPLRWTVWGGCLGFAFRTIIIMATVVWHRFLFFLPKAVLFIQFSTNSV